MPDSPSAILSRAADLIRDRAAAATAGPWSTVRRFDRNGNVRQADFTRPPAADGCAPQTRAVRPHEVPDYEWIALMSPAVAGPVERWLRETSRHVRTFGESADGWAAAPALAFARAVLGEKEESDG